MEDWKGEVAVVTGGASGLGAATARMLAGRGLRVAVFDLGADAGRAMAEEVGGRFFEADVADPASVARAMEEAAAWGQVRVNVNCAGIAVAAKTVSRGEPHDAAEFARVVAVNLVGTFNAASRAAALMAAGAPTGPDGQRGVIVNTASVAAYDGQVGQVAYSASKGGVAGMTLPMARDLADKGVRVCCVAPGLFRTPMLAGLPEEAQASLGAQVPYPPRLGEPGEFAALVGHVLDNPMLNGEVVRLDGAIRMAPR